MAILNRGADARALRTIDGAAACRRHARRCRDRHAGPLRGGAHGAFGAGLLASWSDEGSRPTFNFVTGISTGALQLFRDVLVASAAIPVAFPPVYVDVEVDGQPYREMHVDGGVAAQAFIYPPHLELGRIAEEAGVSRKANLYVIRNSTLHVDGTKVSPRLGAIAARSIDMLIKQQSLGDLVRIYSTALRDGLAFHIAYIPAQVKDDTTEAFDPVFMKKLFDPGYQLAVTGDPCIPPVFLSPVFPTAPSSNPPRRG